MLLQNISGSIDLGSILLKDGTIALNEIVAEAATIVNKIDKPIVFPQKQQLEVSSSGYSLLDQLSLPGLKINEISQSLGMLSGTDIVQLRINNIISSKADIATLIYRIS